MMVLLSKYSQKLYAETTEGFRSKCQLTRLAAHTTLTSLGLEGDFIPTTLVMRYRFYRREVHGRRADCKVEVTDVVLAASLR